VQERGAVAALNRRDAKAPSHRAARLARLGITAVVAAVVVALDQVTKTLAVDHLHHPVHLFGPFGLGLAFNSGVAFSLLQGAPVVVAPVAAVVVALLAVAAWRSRSGTLSVGLGLIVGGALGNLADRAFRGHGGAVVDFITLSHWPTFNFADASITVGAVVVALSALVHSGSHAR
jgi:signal peptidase II